MFKPDDNPYRSKRVHFMKANVIFVIKHISVGYIVFIIYDYLWFV